MLLKRVRVSQLCPGNPDQDFIDLIGKEGWQFLSTSGVVVAALDTGSKVVLDRHSYDKTITYLIRNLNLHHTAGFIRSTKQTLGRAKYACSI